MSDPLTAAVRRALAALPPGARVVCALSGGTDSVALAHCVWVQGLQLGLRVEAAHYNHHLRGAESDRDEAFVRALCAAWGLPLTVDGGRIQRRGTGLEDAARQQRYAFLWEVTGTDWLATAHTQDDQAETVLLQLMRGTGLRGLGGMAAAEGHLLRPLLDIRRSQTEDYLMRHHLPHMEDSSNAAPDFRRNRVRRQLLPLMAQENPQIVPALSGMAARLRQEEDFLWTLTEQTLRQLSRDGALDCAALAALHPALRRRVLRGFSPVELSARQTEALERLALGDNPSGRYSLSDGWTAQRSYQWLRIEPMREAESWQPQLLPVPGICRLAAVGWTVTCEFAPAEAHSSQTGYTFYVPRDTIIGGLTLRPRQSGDTLRLPGGSRSLKRLMIDRHIPAQERGQIPVLADEAGVLGVLGLGANLDRAARAGEPALKITAMHDGNGGTHGA